MKTNKDTIEMIKRVCNTDMRDFHFEERSFEDSFLTTLHAYYFVKPGKTTLKFAKELAQCIIRGLKAGIKTSSDTGLDLNICGILHIIPSITKLCGKYFDAKWFKHQVERMEEDAFDNRLFDKYLDKFDSGHFSHIFQLIVAIGYKKKFFMSEANCRALWEEVNWECHKHDDTLPDISIDYDDFPMVIFDYLDNDTIAKLLLKYIDKDIDLAGYIARVLYYSEPRETLEYLDVAMSYWEYFGLRPFNNRNLD